MRSALLAIVALALLAVGNITPKESEYDKAYARAKATGKRVMVIYSCER